MSDIAALEKPRVRVRAGSRATTEIGLSGTPVYGGFVVTNERDASLYGANRYMTYADIMINTAVVASGVRYFINLVAKASWKVVSANDTDQAKELAEFVESVIDKLNTPWPRVVRRATTFRFYGFGIHEWTAILRKDGRIGFKSLNHRPQHTIERWNTDIHGQVNGFWQGGLSQAGTADVYIPRLKTVYLVDDALSDSPEGLGVLRHLVEPNRVRKRYMQLEGRGYERDLNGIPVGKVPYTALNRAVAQGIYTRDQADGFIRALESFVTMEAKGTATGLILDSQPYETIGEAGRSVSSISQWGVELLKGGSQAHQPMAAAIERTNREMARIIGTEGLMLGGDGAGSLALSKDKSSTLLLQANSTLVDLRGGMRDIIDALWELNGFDEELKPSFATEEIQQRDAEAVTNALKNMSAAGATLDPRDSAVNDVRDLLGISQMDPKHAEEQVKEARKPVPPPVVPPQPGGGTPTPLEGTP